MVERSSDAALLIIGNEILSGRTRDVNLQSLAKGLREIGWKVAEVRVVRDILDDVVEAVNDLRQRHALLFTSGGIGPTHDDITTECMANAFGVPVIQDPVAAGLLRDMYEGTGRKVTKERLSMADIPEGAKTVYCPETAAPGYQIENVYVFAGVPYIFTSMLEEVIGQIKPRPKLQSKTVTVDVGESEVSAELATVQDRHANLEVGSYPQDHNGHHYAELVFSGDDPDAIQKAVDDLTAALDKRDIPWR